MFFAGEAVPAVAVAAEAEVEGVVAAVAVAIPPRISARVVVAAALTRHTAVPVPKCFPRHTLRAQPQMPARLAQIASRSSLPRRRPVRYLGISQNVVDARCIENANAHVRMKRVDGERLAMTQFAGAIHNWTLVHSCAFRARRSHL
jgi:hypothetical protein